MEEKYIHGDLSYKLMGILFTVFKQLGGGYQEKYYQKAIKLKPEEANIPYLEQVRTDLELNGHFIGRYYMDFVIDGKIVLEIKSKCIFNQRDIRQVLGYLKRSQLKLGILANFTNEGVKFKRILRGK